MRKAVLYSATWLVAVAAAIGVGMAAIEAVGDAARGRGALGPEVGPRRGVDPSAVPDAALVGLPEVEDVVRGRYGAFTVVCQGPFARGVRVEPAVGWHAVSFESGPDDDVDALFAKDDRSLEVEVFCNRGRPTLADVEHNEFAGAWTK